MWESLSLWSCKEDRGFTMWRFDKNFRLQREEFIYYLMSAYDDLIYVCAEGHKQNTKKTSLKQAPMTGLIQRVERKILKHLGHTPFRCTLFLVTLPNVPFLIVFPPTFATGGARWRCGPNKLACGYIASSPHSDSTPPNTPKFPTSS